MNILIDATNIGGGGGITHLKEIIKAYDLEFPVTLIAQEKILNQLADYSFLIKTNHKMLNKTLFHRLFFQLFLIDKFIPKDAIVFSVTGDFLGKHKPVVSMSQNMLLYERDVWKEIKQPKEIFRFWLNFHKQKIAFKNSDGLIFISNYAKNYISTQLNLKGKQMTVIHHGISARFVNHMTLQKPITYYSYNNPFKLIYVSTVHVYKHQWNVVKAVGILREKGFPVSLNLVGGVIFEPAGKKLKETIKLIDPRNEFIYDHGHLPYSEIDDIYKRSDGIVFASTCENMPNILIESMASGKPIACSKKQPMPEFIKENAFFFDASDVNSIATSIATMLLELNKRERFVQNNLQEVTQYNWEKASKETFSFITQIFNSTDHV